ncbi:MAG: ribosome-associated translation inhibitor RaiA [Flavobacteriaceae bacterium]|nr:ribosome-associated translation inhibitor RaiA [Flavobacteriaceae bacterium]
MKAIVQSVNFNADQSLIEFAEQKVQKLEKFYDKIISVEIFLKVQQTSEKENKIVEIKINIPGDELMDKKDAKTFEEGISLAVDSLKRRLKKKKEKMR